MFTSKKGTMFVGKTIHQFESLESTNDYASKLISKSSPIEGTVVKTSFQSAGKGQIGRYWSSEADKNVLCSIILKPAKIAPRDQIYLLMAISLAITDVLEDYSVDGLSIKWPNDVYVHDSKICGILIQNTLMDQRIVYSVIGIGLNVNQIYWPEEIPNPTSMCSLLSKEIPVEQVYKKLYQYVEYRYLVLLRKQFQRLSDEYHSLLYRKDVFARYEDDQGMMMATLRQVKTDGSLRLELSDGAFKDYAFRTLRFL